jgi:hypothetical protein
MDAVVAGSTLMPSMDFQGAYHSSFAVHMPCSVLTPSEMTVTAL